MAVETADDRLIFLSDFGVSATYTPFGGVATQITGIIYDEYREVSAGGELGFASSDPYLLVRTDDVPAVAEGDTVVLNATTYRVAVVEGDGTGMTVLQLEAQ